MGINNRFIYIAPLCFLFSIFALGFDQNLDISGSVKKQNRWVRIAVNSANGNALIVWNQVDAMNFLDLGNLPG